MKIGESVQLAWQYRRYKIIYRYYHRWTNVYIWDNKDYDGNQSLIQLGALPLTDEYDMQRKKMSAEDSDLQKNTIWY